MPAVLVMFTVLAVVAMVAVVVVAAMVAMLVMLAVLAVLAMPAVLTMPPPEFWTLTFDILNFDSWSILKAGLVQIYKAAVLQDLLPLIYCTNAAALVQMCFLH